MKKGCLSKVEKFYIENHTESLTVEEISKSLDRSEKTIQNYINQLPDKKPKEKEKETKKSQKTKKNKKSKMDELMGHKERNSQKVATIMTPTASEYSDSQRNTNKKKNMNSIIHKPKG